MKDYKKIIKKSREAGVYKVWTTGTGKRELETTFSELAESEDDVRRRSTIQVLEYARSLDTYNQYGKADIDKNIAWLERQGKEDSQVVFPTFTFDDILALQCCMAMSKEEKLYKQLQSLHDRLHDAYGLEEKGGQKPTDKVEPKFKAGDWIIGRATDNEPRQIAEVTKDGYKTTYGGWFGLSFEEDMHLWTIDDAKDGDVLSYETEKGDLWIMIYQSLYGHYEGHVHYHAILDNDNFTGKGTCCICTDNLKPATKEQRELLFSKMKEAGYEWGNKLILKKYIRRINYNK